MEQHEPESTAQTLKFLESREVQNLLIDAFLSSHSRGQREAVRKHRFWAFASGTTQGLGRRTVQVIFLNDLYAALKRQRATNDGMQGAVRLDGYTLKGDEAEAGTQSSVPRIREKIHEKLGRGSGLLAQLVIESVEVEKQTGYRLALYRSAEVGKMVRSSVGRPSKDGAEYPDDPVLRKNLLTRQSAPVPVARKPVDAVVDKFIREGISPLLILPGSCHSGKTRWMLDYNDRHPASTILYAFDRTDRDLHGEPVFCRHMADTLAALCSVPKNTKRIGSIDSLSKLLALLSGLHGRLVKTRPVVMVDALNEGDAFANDLVEFMAKSLAQGSPGLRYVITIRTPTALLSRLQAIPQSQTNRVFDERETAIGFMEDWLRMADVVRPSAAGSLKSIYDRTGSNLQLVIQSLNAVRGNAGKPRRAAVDNVAKDMVVRVQATCPDTDWPALSDVLRVLSLLPEDSPNGMLGEIVGKSDGEIVRLAAMASETIQSNEVGGMVLRPPDIVRILLSTAFTTQEEIRAADLRVVSTLAAHVKDGDPWGSFCARELPGRVLALADPSVTCRIVTDELVRFLYRNSMLSPVDLVDLLSHRAKCAHELGDRETADRSVLMAATVADSHRRHAKRGDVILRLWQSDATALSVDMAAEDIKLTEEGLISFLALVEAAAWRQGTGLKQALSSACERYGATLRESHGESVIKTLKQRWCHLYAGEAVAALALNDPDAALAVHRTLLAAAKDLGDMGPLFDYTAHLLTRMTGRGAPFCQKALVSVAEKAAEVTPPMPETPAFPLSAISGAKSSAEDRQKVENRERVLNLFGDAENILGTVSGPSKAMFSEILEGMLECKWKQENPTPSTRIRNLVQFHQAVGSLPKRYMDLLLRDLEAELSDTTGFHFADPDVYRDRLKGCRILRERDTAKDLMQRVVDAVLEQPLRDVVFTWPMLSEFDFCSAVLETASTLGEERLKAAWTATWAAAGKLDRRSGEQLAGMAAVLEQGSVLRCEALNSMMVNSLARSGLPDKHKLALRAAMQTPPVSESDRDRCTAAYRTLAPIKTQVTGDVPSLTALARFLAMCVDEGIVEPLEMAARINDMAPSVDVMGHDERLLAKAILQGIPREDRRRAMLIAMRSVLPEDEHLQLCLDVEERCPGTTCATDLAEANLATMSDAHFGVYLDVMMSDSDKRREEFVARLPLIREVEKRALLIHKYVLHVGKAPAFEGKPVSIEPLPTDGTVIPAVSEAPRLKAEALLAIEQHMPYTTQGFRSLHAASRKLEGPLPDTFVSRQIERVLPTLRAAGHQRTSGQIVEAEQDRGLAYSDGKGLAEEVLRCADPATRLRAAERVLGEIPSSGRWITVSFLDTIRSVLAESRLDESFVATLSALPAKFDPRYRAAFYGRLIRYLGDANAEARQGLWIEARRFWFIEGEPLVLKQVGPMSIGLSLLPFLDMPESIAREITGSVRALLAAAKQKGAVHVTGVLALLLQNVKTWLAPLTPELKDAVGLALDSMKSVQNKIPDLMMDDFLNALADITATQDGTDFLASVCAESPKRWETLLVQFCDKRDADGDIETKAQTLIEHLVARTWPGEKAARLWLREIAHGDVGDRAWAVNHLAHPAAQGPHGEEWAQLLDELIDGCDLDMPKEDRKEAMAYLKSPIALARAARRPAYPGVEMEKIILSEAEDYERAWQCLRDAPPAPMQKDTAQDILESVMRSNPPLRGGKDAQTVAVELAGKVFESHQWREAMADTAVESAAAVTSVFKRFHLLLLIARVFKSPTAFRAALDLLSEQTFAEAIPGATPEDLRFIVSVATAFQIRSIYPTIDSAGLARQADLASLQAHAQAYRKSVLQEGKAGGHTAASAVFVDRKIKARAFLDQDVDWAKEIATTAESLQGLVTAERLPVLYWWRLARCARLTCAPSLMRLLAHLRNGTAPDLVLPPDLSAEIMMALVESAGEPAFPELYGYMASFLAASSADREGVYSSLPAQIQLRIGAACSALT